MNNYSISSISTKSFDETVDTVKSTLKEEGFGVLTEIDVQAKMKEEIGLFLPCNVIVYENEDGVIQVSAVKPTVAMSMIDNPNLDGLAKRIEASLQNMIDKI